MKWLSQNLRQLQKKALNKEELDDSVVAEFATTAKEDAKLEVNMKDETV